MLTRLVKDSNVNVEERFGKIQIIGSLEDPAILDKQRAVESDIQAILEDLRKFSRTTSKPIANDGEAVAAITAFLGRFDITCLSAYERGTAIPQIGKVHPERIVLTSDYVQHLQETNRDMFERFIILVKGHMLANALTCPDLEDAPKSYEDVTFYLDTPLLVHWLGLESEQEETATRELLDLVHKLGGEFAVFAHTLDELEAVINSAAEEVADNDPRMPIAYESVRRGKTATELKLEADQIERKLDENGIVTELTPPYNAQFQIDEGAFGLILDEKVRGYRSDRARSHDINSVRGIYAIRRDDPARSLEKARAVLVTSNGRFADAAWLYGRQYLASSHVSTVIADFSLANTAWLKAPIEAPDVPITQMLAFSYAALRPPDELWQRYLAEIDKLQDQGAISHEQHVLLRSYDLVSRDLVHLTLGENAAIKHETINQTVDRVTGRLTRQADDKFDKELEEHHITSQSLRSEIVRSQETRESLSWWCRRAAGVIAWTVSGAIVIAFLSAIVGGFFLGSIAPVVAWVVGIGSGLLTLGSLLSLVFSSSVKGLHSWLREKCSCWLFTFIARALAIDTRDFDSN